MKIIFTLLLLAVFFGFTSLHSTAASGIPAKNSDTLEKANQLFDAKAYLLALPLYDYLLDNDGDKKKGFYKYRLGICCLYKTDQHGRALELLTEVEQENKKAADIEFYLGRAYMLNYKFDDAVVRFTSYMIKDKSSAKLKEEAEQYISNCNNGKALLASPINVKITNLGMPVNTSASEYVPVLSSDESVLIFTYRGEKSKGGVQEFDINDPNSSYTEDVFIADKINGNWSTPYEAGDNINSFDHDACIALSGDGQKLFVFKNNGKDLGDIYMSRLDGKNWSVPELLQGDVNTNKWEGSCSITANERTLYFSSERDGGFGGRDLYRASLQHDGSWGNVKNLGPDINTPFDDDAPFIHPDGTTLIFSSKGHTSMGGYDIFKSFRLDTSWAVPENMGYPVNTPGDDIYYVLSADGNRGYYSSEKTGGFGQQDIYMASPGLAGWKPALLLLKGIVTINDVPTEAAIEVTLANNRESVGIYKANASTGKYLINLPAGADYKITYRKFGYPEQTKVIANSNADSYSEITYDIQFFTKRSLSRVDASGNKIFTGEQIGWNAFTFSSLPPDSVIVFLLTEDDTAFTRLFIVVNEKTYKLERCSNEKYFCLFQKGKPANTNMVPTTDPIPADTTPVVKPVLTENTNKTPEVPFGKAANYDELVTLYGALTADGLEFKVQIGAYRNPQNFNYDKLKSLGEIDRKTYDDQITRFSMGALKTLNDADKLLKQIHAKGRTDAFVTAFYNGKRFLLRDLGTLKK